MVNVMSRKDDEGLGKDQYSTRDITSEAMGGLDSFWTYTSVYRICYEATSNKDAAVQCICDSIPRIRVSKS